MTLSFADLAQGEVKGFPHYFEMKHKIREHENGHPFRFTLVSNQGVEQEVEFIRSGSRGSNGDMWYAELVVCPVETIDTKVGTRPIHIEVDRSTGRAIYV